MTHYDESPVIDFGAHFHAVGSRAEEQFDKYKDLIGPRLKDPDRYLQWFKEGGYDGAVLSQPYFMGHNDSEVTASANDDLLEVIDRHDEFYGLAALPVAAGGSTAAEEFERCLENGYNGGALTAEVNGVDPSSPEIEPVLEVANDTGAPLLVHPTANNELSSVTLEYSFEIHHAYGREARLCGVISKLIHRGTLDKFPNLNFVIHHLGGNIACMLGRTDLRLDTERWGRWPTDENGDRGKAFDDFKSQLEDRIYIDTSGYSSYETPIRAAIEQLPASQILLGTDAPFEPRTAGELDRYVTTIQNATPRDAARKVLGQNALDLLLT